MVSDGKMVVNNNVERCCGQIWGSIYLEVLRKTTKNLSQDSWSLGQDLNVSP
jgi:hypothetical protein